MHPNLSMLASAASAMEGSRVLSPTPASSPASRVPLEHAPVSCALRPAFVTLEDLYNLILQLRADVQELQSLLEDEEADACITIPQAGLWRQSTQSPTQGGAGSK